jgi:hypothetical protein
MGISAFLLFLLAGVAFGYAAVGLAKLIPVLFPIVLALGTVAREGLEGEILLRLFLAIVVTLVGVALGRVIEDRTAGGEPAGAT